MGLAAKIAAQYFETKDLKVAELDEGLLRVGWNFEGGSMAIFLKFDDEDAHVHLEGLDFAKIPENKIDNMYKVLNEANDKYTHVKFVMSIDEEDGTADPRARDDDIIQLDSCGPECFELMLRMLSVVEDAYPMFMKAIWS